MDDFKSDDKNNNLDQCDILKFIFYDIFFAKAPTGPSYVDMDQNNSNKDDLTMLCEHCEMKQGRIF